MKCGTIQAQAACKYQRRGCSPDCALASYFSADWPQLFQDVHRLFGVSKILKMLKQLSDDEEEDEAMKSIIYESEIRRRFPVHGRLGIIWMLKEQKKQFQEPEEFGIMKTMYTEEGSSMEGSVKMFAQGDRIKPSVGKSFCATEGPVEDIAEIAVF
ncbi:hypothetical protein Ancab_006187 [Ancistrocladus abbreviatus]